MAKTFKNQNVNVIRDFPFPNNPWFQEKNAEETLDYVPHDGDIVLACYPKTGSTWLQYIVLQILSQGDVFPSFEDVVTKVAPVMELSGKDKLDALIEPRVYKHHLPYNMVQKNKKAKVVYVYRNPEDTFASYFHFLNNMELKAPMEFDECFEFFLTGDIDYGNYFQNVLSYVQHKDDDNLLMVSYERLKRDTRNEILRIAKFLGDNYYSNIANDEELLNKILECTSFDYMKKNLSSQPQDQAEKGITSDFNQNFFRKGIIGDGKQALSADQLRRLREAAAEVLKGTEIINEWLGEN